jgi:hypothetical protein
LISSFSGSTPAAVHPGFFDSLFRGMNGLVKSIPRH